MVNKIPMDAGEIELLAKQVSFEMEQWLINRLMDIKYGDSLKVIKRVDDLFHERVEESLR